MTQRNLEKKDIEQVFFAKMTQRKYKWHRAILLFVVKICCSLAYFSDQSSSWFTSKWKNQLSIRKRMLSLWKLVGCSVNHQYLKMHRSLSTICKTFLNLNHLTLLWWRGFYPIILFFEFLKNSCKYQIQIYHNVKLTKPYRIKIDTKILM